MIGPRQLSVFELPSHRDDPETSREAAKRKRSTAATDREMCVDALRRAGRHGLTHDEVDAVHGWDDGRANRRLSDLVREPDPRVVRLPRKRLTRRNSPAHVYVHRDHATPAEIRGQVEHFHGERSSE